MKTKLTKKPAAFSLVELLMVLTIISIMAALIINAFSNAAQDSRDVLSRQQQATLKSALDNAISQYLASGASPSDTGKTVEQARKYYTYANGVSGTLRNQKGRLALLEDYLDEDTFEHFNSRSSATMIQSAAMVKTNQFVEFEEWPVATAANRNTYPKVKLSVVP